MGLFDEAQPLFSKTKSNVSKTTRIKGLNSELKELEKQKTALFARLGAELYVAFSSDSNMRERYQVLFQSIEDLDYRINEINYTIESLERIETEADLGSRVCPKCGNVMQPDDMFCRACGAKVDTPNAGTPTPVSSGVCPKCKAPLAEGQAFCVRCGSKVR